MHDAFILARPANAWDAPLARWLADAGLAVHRVPAAEAGAVFAATAARLVLAAPEAIDSLELQRARRDGALLVCVGPAPADTWDADTCDDVLGEPVTEAAVLRLLARHRYVAIAGSERAGLAEAIARQTFGDATLAGELLRALATSTESDLQRLREEGDSLEALRGVAHRMKASAHLAGCDGFRRLAQRLEDAARSGDATLAEAVAAIFKPTASEFHAMLVARLG